MSRAVLRHQLRCRGTSRSGLAAGAEALFAEEFAGRVLVLGAAARRYAEIVILRRQAGKPIEASTR